MGKHQQFFSTKEVAKILGLHYITINRLVNEGRLQVYQIGNKFLIRWRDVEKFRKSQAVVRVTE